MYTYDQNYSSGLNTVNQAANTAAGMGIWVIISLVIAVIGGIIVYFLFFKPDKDMPNKFLTWLKDFFNFHKMLVEDMLKIIYIVLAIFITLASFSLIAVNFVSFLLVLILGNLILRLMFEFSLINIMIWKNTTDINKRLKTSKKD